MNKFFRNPIVTTKIELVFSLTSIFCFIVIAPAQNSSDKRLEFFPELQSFDTFLAQLAGKLRPAAISESLMRGAGEKARRFVESTSKEPLKNSCFVHATRYDAIPAKTGGIRSNFQN